MAFEIKISNEGNTPIISFYGIFDESARLPNPDKFFEFEHLIIDFQNLRFINSAGIAIYLRFLQKIEEQEVRFTYRNCPKGIVSQINTIVGFLPEKGEVESFYLPIFCEKCQKNFDFHVRTSDFRPEDIEVREITKNIQCDDMPGCKKHHGLDVIPKHYFRFLRKKT